MLAEPEGSAAWGERHSRVLPSQDAMCDQKQFTRQTHRWLSVPWWTVFGLCVLRMQKELDVLARAREQWERWASGTAADCPLRSPWATRDVSPANSPMVVCTMVERICNVCNCKMRAHQTRRRKKHVTVLRESG